MKNSLPTKQADHLRVKARKMLASHRQRAKQLGIVLDYGLNDLLAMLREAQVCAYCRMPLGFKAIEVDHQAPTSRGGAHALWNLIVCCHDCNSAKGMLSKPEFLQLMEVLNDFHDTARRDVLLRLRAGGERYGRGRKRKGQP